MPRFFVKNEQIKGTKIEILGEDVKHIKNVLRKQIRDNIEICDQDTEKSYICEIEKIGNESILTNIIEELQSYDDNIKVDIYQGLPKADKMELIIQKSVELGVYDIIPIEMKRCVVKVNEKDKQKKLQRWQKISEVAAKQCGRNIIPKIKPILNLKNICNMLKEYDIVLLAYEKEEKITIKQELNNIKENLNNNSKFKIAVIVGPEGGISTEEVELLQKNGAKSITLGKRILRTETASISIMSNIVYEFEL